MRLAGISLATKYRLLFGTAVVLIIGAALSVPWYYMEAMVLQPPFREAQRIADGFFRHEVAGAPGGGAAAAGAHGGDTGLLPEGSEQAPTFIPTDPDPNDPRAPGARGALDPFADDALRTLRKLPHRESYYRTTWNATGRRFRYAHAVWVTRRCLNCHTEGRSARPFRENQLAGLILVDLPAEVSWQYSLLNRLVIVAAGALAGIFAVLLFYVITTRFILAPIHELRSVALRVSDGDLGVRASIRSGPPSRTPAWRRGWWRVPWCASSPPAR